MAFLREKEPVRGAVLPVLPGVSRIVAPNPGVMTYHGTNTYLIERPEGVYILDPGPDDESHIEAVVEAAGTAITGIFLTHNHADHSGGAPMLKAATGLPVHGFILEEDDSLFTPDIPLGPGDMFAGLIAIHTPGHAPDHLCFAGPDGVVFSGDHVMGWSSSVVSPPRGEMAAYFASLALMLSRPDRLYLPGHGPALPNPHPYVAELLARRQAREEAILELLAAGAMDIGTITAQLYNKTHPRLQRAAERNVSAHLIKLRNEGKVDERMEVWREISAS